ncbi:hypothetical protein [Paenibacillus donghaensis]|uniref:hypothetical protein n=1 Tax=Paenibacillus donghaensis TaxID=414771 RepID=UPI001FE53FBD|nr:hypothetical protein [Paenibacillus donghaensis]
MIPILVMSRILHTQQPAHLGAMFLEAGGSIGYHQAPIPRLLLIVAGEGKVKGAEEVYCPVQAGDAVFWKYK